MDGYRKDGRIFYRFCLEGRHVQRDTVSLVFVFVHLRYSRITRMVY